MSSIPSSCLDLRYPEPDSNPDHYPTRSQKVLPVTAWFWMVSHHMQCLPTFKPLLHSIDFTQLDDGVKVTRHEGIHLGVKSGEESPDHGEYVDGIGKEVMG